MKKIFMALVALVCMVGGFAESHRFNTKLKGLQNDIVNYVEDNLDKNFESFRSYGEYVVLSNQISCLFTKEEEDWFNYMVENSAENSWYRYWDKAWSKYSHAKKAFGGEISKKDEKKAGRIIEYNKTSLCYMRVVFNAGEVAVNGRPSPNCMQWEFFLYTDENNKDHVLYVWQGSKNNDPKDFVTYID